MLYFIVGNMKIISLPKFELYWTMGSVSLMHLVPTMMVIGQSWVVIKSARCAALAAVWPILMIYVSK